MNALLDTLAAAGIVLTVDGSKLWYTAPTGALTPALRAAIAAHRADLLVLLAAETMPEWRQDGPHATVPATDQHQPIDAGLRHPDAAAPYACTCGELAAGPCQQIGPDCWQGECSAGHLIQRTAYSFQHPPEVHTGRPVLPATMPAEPLELWCYDRVHGIEPATPAPDELTAEKIAGAVAAARDDFDRLVHPVVLRYRRKPSPYRDLELVARVLDAGLRLGWPALPLRPGERLAAGHEGGRGVIRIGWVAE